MNHRRGGSRTASAAEKTPRELLTRKLLITHFNSRSRYLLIEALDLSTEIAQLFIDPLVATFDLTNISNS